MGKAKERSKLRKWCVKNILDGYRWYSRKLAFPAQYKKYSKAPVDERKVVFIEIRFDRLSNSMTLLRDRFEASSNYDVHEWYLHLYGRDHRAQHDKAMACVKDIATARYIIICEGTDLIGCLDLRPETYVLQTWHGCGLIKKCGFSTVDTAFGRDLKTQLKYPLYENMDMVTAASTEEIWTLEDAMNLKGQGIVKPVGVSRTDVFFDEDFVRAAKEKLIEVVPLSKEKKTIRYSPTFRGEMKSAASPDALDIDVMAKALTDEYVLIIKHHPLVKNRPKIPAEWENKFAYDVSDTMNIDGLICASDICISDYSSIIYEYSLFERPIVLFAPDKEEYADKRGMYYDYEELMPGPIFTDTESLVDYIVHIDKRFDKKRVTEFKNKHMSACDGHATDRILAEMGASL